MGLFTKEINSVVNTGLAAVEITEKKTREKIRSIPSVREAYQRLSDSELIKNGFCLAWLGVFTSGKSTIIDAILGYPLLPVSTAVMTAASTKIRYSPTPYVKIIDQGNVIYHFNKPLEKGLFSILKRFFLECESPETVGLENAIYFKDSQGNCTLNPANIQDNLLLLINLFASYVRQNDNDYGREEIEKLKELRNQIFSKYFSEIAKDASRGKAYAIEVGWDCDVLKSGLVFIDLPGLGSTVEDCLADNARIHDDLTFRALEECQALVLTYSGKPLDDEVRQALSKWLNTAKFKKDMTDDLKDPTRNLRIINLVNQFDRMPRKDDTLKVVVNSIDSLLRQYDIENTPVYGVSALYAAEAYYIQNGLITHPNAMTALSYDAGDVEYALEEMHMEEALRSAQKKLLKKSRFTYFKDKVEGYGDTCRLVGLSSMTESLVRYYQTLMENVCQEMKAKHLVWKNTGLLTKDIFYHLKVFLVDLESQQPFKIDKMSEDLGRKLILELEGIWREREVSLERAAEQSIRKSIEDFLDKVDKLNPCSTLYESRKYIQTVQGSTENGPLIRAYLKEMERDCLKEYNLSIQKVLTDICKNQEQVITDWGSQLKALYDNLENEVREDYRAIWNIKIDYEGYRQKLKVNLPGETAEIEDYYNYCDFLDSYHLFVADRQNYRGNYKKQYEFADQLGSQLASLFCASAEIDAELYRMADLKAFRDEFFAVSNKAIRESQEAVKNAVDKIKEAFMGEFTTGTIAVNTTKTVTAEARNLWSGVKHWWNHGEYKVTDKVEAEQIPTSVYLDAKALREKFDNIYYKKQGIEAVKKSYNMLLRAYTIYTVNYDKIYKERARVPARVMCENGENMLDVAKRGAMKSSKDMRLAIMDDLSLLSSYQDTYDNITDQYRASVTRLVANTNSVKMNESPEKAPVELRFAREDETGNIIRISEQIMAACDTPLLSEKARDSLRLIREGIMNADE